MGGRIEEEEGTHVQEAGAHHPARLRIIGGALCALLYATLSGSAEYYKHVDEVMTNPQQWYGKSLQLHGFVVDNSRRAQAGLARLAVPGAEQRQGRDGHLRRAWCPTPSRAAPRSC